jgi:hypothetical protein
MHQRWSLKFQPRWIAVSIQELTGETADRKHRSNLHELSINLPGGKVQRAGNKAHSPHRQILNLPGYRPILNSTIRKWNGFDQMLSDNTVPAALTSLTLTRVPNRQTAIDLLVNAIPQTCGPQSFDVLDLNGTVELTVTVAVDSVIEVTDAVLAVAQRSGMSLGVKGAP